MDDILYRFQIAMSDSGLICPELPVANTTTFQRFGINGDKDKPCYYILTILPSGFAFGLYGCFKRDIKETWYSKDSTHMSVDEKLTINNQIKEIEKQRINEQLKFQEEQLKKAKDIWFYSESAQDNHPYLIVKRVKSFGLHISNNGELVVPVQDSENEIYGLQFIGRDGNKKFFPGTSKKGHYFLIKGDEKVIYLAEGYATAASIHQATGNIVIVAFDAGNLLSVSETIRKTYPNSEIVFAADNDQFGDVNIGVEKAKQAAKVIGAKVAIPQFKTLDSKPTDFNDLMILEGIDEVRRQLEQYSETLIENNENDRPRASSASKVIELMNDIELFHDAQRITYATIEDNGHKETWRLDSANFQDWLSHKFWEKHRQGISKAVLQDALITLQGKALYEGECREVYTRVGMINDAVYINLANEDWEIVQVTNSGWEVLQNSPLKFTRTSHMKSLPRPTERGDFNLFWKYVNIPEQYRKLVLAYILECFRSNTPYPILVLTGMQGSAKSTTQEFIRMLIDPSESNLRSAPKKSEDLFVSAANNWLVSFNNVSHLSPAMQDDLCCVATGGGYSTRELYTTCNETSFNIKRPVIINGIGEFITAQDLIDRCLILELPEISEQARKTEGAIKKDFEKHYSEILGGLLDILSSVLKVLPNVNLKNKPRMADFALLGTALETVMHWGEGSFMREYNQQRQDNLISAMEHSPVAIALIKFMEHELWYENSFARLYDQLTLPKYRSDMSGWPKSAKGLANQLRRQITALRACGLELTVDSIRHADGYHVSIKKLVKQVQDVQQVHSTAMDKAYRAERLHEHSSVSSESSGQVQA